MACCKNFSHQKCSGMCACILAVLCIIGSFCMFPGFLKLANDITLLQAAIAPMVLEGAVEGAKLEDYVLPKIDKVLFPVNESWLALTGVREQLQTSIETTRRAIFQQGRLFWEAGQTGDMTEQAKKKDAAVAQAELLYSNLDRETNVTAKLLEPVHGIQNLIKEFQFMKIVITIEKALKVVGQVYDRVQGAYRTLNDLGKFFGKPLPVVKWPDLSFLQNVSDVLDEAKVKLQLWTSDVANLADKITGELPRGDPWRKNAVRVRLQDIADNIKESSRMHDPEMASTIALAAFHKVHQETEDKLDHGRHVLGNISYSLSNVRNATTSGSDMINALAGFFDTYHNVPGLVSWMVYGEIVFCLFVTLWVLGYTFARHLCGCETQSKVCKCLFTTFYFIFYVLLQVFVLYCIALLLVAIIALVVYYGLAAGPCDMVSLKTNEHSLTYVKVVSHRPFCEQYVYPTQNALPGCVWAAFAVLMLAVNLLAAYHGMMGDHLPGDDSARETAADKGLLDSDTEEE